ncbi:undecaprenyl phosphate N,N'-diacetylbacillosamine 1-phosphate transferase [Marivirga tractuosa]|uniref:Sugar transferase n=1 Tax=Marivirga tractuosa (strain ATCC 23168 / DSM 4126 / NBRC 15989 / NCIMB 1408 / VKM B-1430 / H-43) TaxID=643867 RepID=E4TMP5_MARTH|nr:sugar transferase [Marivirga tractuosa]ADR20343.1 sugar transferase [Marivirga tractuosa DSM 4126]BDD15215.1 undecaprenyl phosphate N,N'-diacetylbacillosamine 1-phosphate transferase [Marivirga tractuosa]
MYAKIFKPFFDRITALIALIIASPIFVLVSFLLAIFQSGKVFFTQKRPGLNEEIFLLIKFKTMRDDQDENGELLPDEQRLTWIGKIVRKTSMDEIPQLLNIIKGDMSFIGPRPLLVEYLPLYSEEQRKRHFVTPGITGWAQINGRNTISWQKKFEYDVWYVQNQSFLLDIKIIFMTVLKVFKAEGISAEGVATMEKFKGD